MPRADRWGWRRRRQGRLRRTAPPSREELGELRAEVETLLRAISGRDDEECWTHRLGNIAEAITVAAAFGDAGAVTIS